MNEQFEHQWSGMNHAAQSLNECINKPCMEIAQLNAKAANRFISESTSYIERFLGSKKPEDFMALNVELANKNGQEVTEYVQELGRIIASSLTKASETMFNVMNTAANQAVKSGEEMQSATLHAQKRQEERMKK